MEARITVPNVLKEDSVVSIYYRTEPHGQYYVAITVDGRDVVGISPGDFDAIARFLGAG